MVAPARISAVLGIKPVKERSKLRPLILRGFHPDALTHVSESLGISGKALMGALNISPTTYKRRARKGELMTPEESDRLFRLAQVFALAIDVFDSEENAAAWFQEEIMALGGERPIDLMRTSVGVREVEDVLGRLDHGVYS